MPTGALELDVGCGTADLLCDMATENPGVQYIGIDINEHACQVASRKVAKRALTNVLISHSEALQFLRTTIPSRSVRAFHIYFPTPWIGEIVRHNPLGTNIKGVLFDSAFVSEIARAAIPGATLRLVTDQPAYFRRAVNYLAEAGFVATTWGAPARSIPKGMVLGTEWERKVRVFDNDRTVYFYQGLLTLL